MITPVEVLAIQDLKATRQLRPEDFRDRDLTRAEFEHVFKLCDGFWFHSGNPADPHAELTGGDCSNGFINCLMGLQHTNICQIMAGQMIRLLRRFYDGPVDVATGSNHAAVALGKDVANLLNARYDFPDKGEGKAQIWNRIVVEPGESVLHVEELMTTSLTATQVRAGMRKGNPHPVKFVPLLLVMVHRSSVVEFEGQPVIWLYHYEIWKTSQENCPLCKQGSRRLRPKQTDHWAELTGKK